MDCNMIGGYKVLPLRFSSTSTAQHYLFVKEHSAKPPSSDKPKGQTLFVTNIPPYANKKSIKQAFEGAGTVKDIIFEGEQNSFRICYIVFQRDESLQKALKLDHLKPLSSDKNQIKTGITKWIQNYNNSIQDDKLRQRIQATVQAYDRNETKKTDSKDDEGWTLVTKASRNPGLSRKESLKNKLNEKGIKKKKYLKNFYTFQIRESKKNHIANLRKKYEEDKKRVEALKQARKFKPF